MKLKQHKKMKFEDDQYLKNNHLTVIYMSFMIIIN